MFTKDEINGVAATSLDTIDQMNWLALIRMYPKYEANPGRYPNLEAALAALDGTDAKKQVKARQLILAYDYINENINFGTEAMTPTVKSSIDFSNTRDLAQVMDFVLSVLYDTAKLSTPKTSGVSARLSDAALFGGRCCTGCGALYDDSIIPSRCRC